jgi:Cu2+-containing amine oxidase
MKEKNLAALKLVFTLSAVLGSVTTLAHQPSTNAYQTKSEQPSKLAIRTQVGMAYSAEERSQIVSFVLNHPEVAAMVKGQKVKALTVTSDAGEKPAAGTAATQRIATVTFFNYTSGTAFRASVDLDSSQVVQVQRIVGRPPASEEEIQEAKRVLEGHPQIKQLLDGRGVIEGGFIVDPPRGSPAKDRFVQFHILSPDRQKIEQVVTVDLTENKVAATANFGK